MTQLNLVIHDPLVFLVCLLQIIMLVYHIRMLKTSNTEEIDFYRGGQAKNHNGVKLMMIYSMALLALLATVASLFYYEVTRHVEIGVHWYLLAMLACPTLHMVSMWQHARSKVDDFYYFSKLKKLN